MAWQVHLFAAAPGNVCGEMKRLIVPWTLAHSAARHLAWYVAYQLTGQTRSRS